MSPNLEQITQKETSFLQSIRKSIASKLAVLISAGTFALASCGDETFTPHKHDQPPKRPHLSRVYQGGIYIKSGKTNSDGQIFFTDEQNEEPVTVTVKSESGNTIPDAPVAFFDGNGFEAYQVNHPNFTPYLHVFSHNSSQELTLTSDSMQFHIFDGSSKENSNEAAQKFTGYTKAHSQWKGGCELADEIIIDTRERIVALGEISGRVHGGETGEYIAILGAGLIDGATYLKDKFTEWGITENECVAYQTWANEDVSEWNLGPSLGLKVYRCLTSIPPENCYDGVDNDCDHEIDFEDEDCNIPSCSDECNSAGYPVCVNNAWKECGDFDSDECLEWSSLHYCNSDEACQDGQCVPTCIPSTEICDGIDNDCDKRIDENDVCGPDCVDECINSGQRDCFGDGWKECGNFDSDECLEWSLLTLCGADNYCEDGNCLPNHGTGSYCDPCESDHDCQEGMFCGWYSDTDITWCSGFFECNDDSDCGGEYVCYENVNFCTPLLYLDCHEGNVWVRDNCDNWIGVEETCDIGCQDGQCCAVGDHKICNNNEIWWVDSCGNLGTLYRDCNQELDSDGDPMHCLEASSETVSCYFKHCYNGDSFWRRSPDSINNYILAEECGDNSCIDGECTGCFAQDHLVCHNGDSYWVDSCGNISGIDEICGTYSVCSGGVCVNTYDPCDPFHDHIVCHEGSLYWADNCNDVNNFISHCDEDETCSEGVCIPNHCDTDSDCGLEFICKKSTGECLPKPSPLCTTSPCTDVEINIYDSGSDLDDVFGLEIVGSFYGETDPGGSKTWVVPMVSGNTYQMNVYGVGIPDGVGTYTVTLTNATVLNGPPLSGDDLDDGITFSWDIEAD